MLIRRWFILFCILMQPVMAHAGEAFFAALYQFVVTYWAEIAAIAFSVVESAMARADARAAAARRRDEYNDALRDRTAMLLDSAPPWRVIHGRATVGGFIAAQFTSDHTGVRPDGTPFTKRDGFRHLVIAIAAHECFAIHEVFINGKAIGARDVDGWPIGGPFVTTVDHPSTGYLNGSGALDVPGGISRVLTCYTINEPSAPGEPSVGTTEQPYVLSAGNTHVQGTPGATFVYLATGANATVRVSTHLGVANQAVDAYLNSVKPQEWDASHILAGWTYATITLDLENSEFQGGPPSITFDVSGRLLYDLRRQLLPNTIVAGAVAGAPGTVPTDYSFSGTQNNLVRSVVAVGEEFGIPYFDVQWVGTANAAGQLVLQFSTAGAAAVQGETMYGGVYMRPLVGSMAQFTAAVLAVEERTGAGSSNGSSALNIAAQLFGSANIRDNRVVVSRTMTQATTARATHALKFNYANGAAINFRVRVGLPTLSKGADAIAFSANPALATADFLKGEWGYQVLCAEINEPALITAANDCDDTLTFEYRNEAGTVVSSFNGPRYTLNGAFTTADSKEAVLEDMKTAMAGYAIPSGQWYIAAGVWHPPVMSLSDDNLMGHIQIVQTGAQISETINSLRGNYFPSPTYGTGVGYVLNGAHAANATTINLGAGTGTVPANVALMFAGDDTMYLVKTGVNGPGAITLAYPGLSKAMAAGTAVTLIAQGGQSPADFEPYINSTYVNADGEPLWASTTFPYTNDKARCRNLARIKLEKSRNGLVINYPAKMVAWPLQPNDRVLITSAEFEFVDKAFRVTDWSFGSDTPVTLTCQEDSAATWDDADATLVDQTPNSTMADPTRVAPIKNLLAASGTAQLLKFADGTIQTRVYVTWDNINASFVTGGQGYVEVSWFGPFDDSPHVVKVSGDDAGCYITDAPEGQTIIISAVIINSLPARSSPVYISHRVVGKTSPPLPVAGITATQIPGFVRILWTADNEADEEGVELGIGGSWNAATGLEGQAAKSFASGPGVNSYDWAWPAPGAYNIRARRRDTSGNLSTEVILGITVTTTGLSIDWTSLSNRPLDTSNMVLTPTFEGGAVRTWSGGSVVSVGGQSWGKALSVSSRDTLQNGLVPVKAGEKLWVQADINTAASPYGAEFGFVAYTAAGVASAVPRLPTVPAGTGWTHIEGFVQVPVDAVSIQPDIVTEGFAAFGSVLVTNLYIGRATPGATAGTVDLSLVATSGILLSGNTAVKTSVTAAWDQQVSSVDGFVGGAFASATTPTNGSTIAMFGLNGNDLNDLLDPNYDKIDYAWYVVNSSLEIYESGTPKLVGLPFSFGDVLTVIYDGQFVRYYQNGVIVRTVSAKPGLKLFFDSSFNTVNSTLKNIRFGPYQNSYNGRAGNLLDTSWWSPGVNPLSKWNGNQGGGSDAFVVAELPDGSTGIVWSATSDTVGQQGGGWNATDDPTSSFPVDSSKTYMMVCYFRGASNPASEYFGPHSGTVCDLNSATPAANPYFGVAAHSLSWHMIVGWIYPAGSTGHSNGKAGVYNCDTGQLVAAGSNFNWAATTTKGFVRAFQYYAPPGSIAVQHMAWLAAYICDGSEPSLDDLLSMIVPTCRIAFEAATEVQTIRSASGSVSTSYPSEPFGKSQVITTLTYLNDTNAPVVVQYEHSCVLAVSGGTAGNASLFSEHSVSGGGGAFAAQFTPDITNAQAFPASYSDSVTVPVGATVTITLSVRAQALSSGTVTATWSSASSRSSAIKK